MNVIKKDFVSILFGDSLLSAGGGEGGGATFGGPLGRKSPTQAFDVTVRGPVASLGTLRYIPIYQAIFLVKLCKIHPASTYLIKNYG